MNETAADPLPKGRNIFHYFKKRSPGALIALGFLFTIFLGSGLLMLLEEGEYTRETKLENSRYAGITAIYWAVILAGYLVWSFLSGRWDRTWIVWPVSGALYGVLRAILRTLQKKP